ncbi:hypothetical protein GVY41_07040 [Frigidibacter albus]|uniref:CMD domain protein n=1 Tax=Frigidibacter albus TaxID=1465486 RepID=A0A6L8VJ33_9RHOB|nr:hypothetical protein [Frigidibacter albus]MZQ89190.1 hypothetical protein [Frigidibacter albus]NBE30753.1 hypothetical protein [Frigidibacter albus]GGH50856.1 esterase [Frigidibacter albus]
MTDAIDRAAGLAPGDALHALRRLRPEFVDGAELCRVSVLTPASDQGLSPDLRAALARRMALQNADPSLADPYGGADPELRRLAEGETDLPEPLASIAAHVDLVTQTPAKAAAESLRRLERAGLTNPQIVALSELIAYVNFQARIAAGLRLMKEAR